MTDQVADRDCDMSNHKQSIPIVPPLLKAKDHSRRERNIVIAVSGR